MLTERPRALKETDMSPRHGFLNDPIGRHPEILGCVEYLFGGGDVIRRTDKKIGRAGFIAEVQFPEEADERT